MLGSREANVEEPSPVELRHSLGWFECPAWVKRSKELVNLFRRPSGAVNASYDDNRKLQTLGLMDGHHLNHAEWGGLFFFDIIDARRMEQVEERGPQSPR